jgi:hypothetical protein
MIRYGVVPNAGTTRGVVVASHPFRGALLALIVTALAACTSGTSNDGDSAAPPTTAQSTAGAAVPSLPDVGQVPIEHDAGYDDAVAAFGVDAVEAAATADARIAHIALADCVRWTTGVVDPRLTDLLTPALLARVTEELDRPAGTVTSLLSHLPGDDGNGNDEAAAVLHGCDASAPLRYGPWPVTVAVDRTETQPRLVLTGSFVIDLAFGETRVQAGQDWVFTSEQTPVGWRLADVTATAHVNWAPPREG